MLWVKRYYLFHQAPDRRHMLDNISEFEDSLGEKWITISAHLENESFLTDFGNETNSLQLFVVQFYTFLLGTYSLWRAPDGDASEDWFELFMPLFGGRLQTVNSEFSLQAKSREYYHKSRQDILRKRREEYQRNRQKIVERQRCYYEKSKEQRRIKQNENYAKNQVMLWGGWGGWQTQKILLYIQARSCHPKHSEPDVKQTI